MAETKNPMLQAAEIEEITPLVMIQKTSGAKVEFAGLEQTPKEAAELKRKKRLLLEEVRTAIDGATILKARVASVQPLRLRGLQTACLAFPLDAKINDVKVVIPFKEVFQNEPKFEGTDALTEEGEKDLLKRQMQFLRGLIGAVVRYLPENIIEQADGSYTIIGSRANALAIEREYYYCRENANIKVGGIYNARVMVVNPGNATIALGGVEKVIPIRSLTNRYCPDLRDLYEAGSVIPVFISDLKVKDNDVDVTFDCLKGEAYSSMDNAKSIVRGEVTFARISKIVPYTEPDGTKRTRLYGWHESWNLPVRFTKIPANRHGRPIEIGDRVRFVVVAQMEDGYITGDIQSIVTQAEFN